jgi:hypothetical protein
VREASVGDEPYAALLPVIVFAVLDRARGGGPLWASCGALVVAVTLLATASPRERAARSVVVQGAVVLYIGIAIASIAYGTHTGVIAQYGRAISAGGYAVLAFGSLAFTPATDYYFRPIVRSGRWNDPEFERLNVTVTLIWAFGFTTIALSHVTATLLDAPGPATIFNWVIPMAVGTIAARRTRVCWDDFNDDDLFEPDPMRDLDLDWKTPPVGSTDI